MTDRERLIAELAKRHGTRIDPDDPILIGVLLNRQMIDDAAAVLQASVRELADRITAASLQHMKAAEQSAAALITQAGEWSAERLRSAAEEAGSALLLQVRQEVAAADRASRTAVRAAWTMGTVGAIALAGLAGFLLAGLGHG
jgi:hypothetical protein